MGCGPFGSKDRPFSLHPFFPLPPFFLWVLCIHTGDRLRGGETLSVLGRYCTTGLHSQPTEMACRLIWLAIQPQGSACLYAPLVLAVQAVQAYCSSRCFLGCWDLNSGPHARTAGTWHTEPFLSSFCQRVYLVFVMSLCERISTDGVGSQV